VAHVGLGSEDELPALRIPPAKPLTSLHEWMNVITGSYVEINFHQLSDPTMDWPSIFLMPRAIVLLGKIEPN